MPAGDPDQMSMRIAPRTFLCATASRLGGVSVETGYTELRDLCTASGDQRSLAVGMIGIVSANLMKRHREEASRLAGEQVRLLEAIDDPTLTVALLPMALLAKTETAEMPEVLRLAQQVIDLADGDFSRGNMVFGSPLAYAIAMRGIARACLGRDNWKDDLLEAIQATRVIDPFTRASIFYYTHAMPITFGLFRPDDSEMYDVAETLSLARQSGENLALFMAETTQGVVLVCREPSDRKAGLEFLERGRQSALNHRFMMAIPPVADSYIAREMARAGDVDGAIELARSAIHPLFATHRCIDSALAATAFVEVLLQRGGQRDVDDAQAAIDWLAAVPTEEGFVLNEITLLRLRALLARATGEDADYRNFRDRYRKMATDLGFEGHIEWAAEMD
jgi:adenylate cyclase